MCLILTIVKRRLESQVMHAKTWSWFALACWYCLLTWHIFTSVILSEAVTWRISLVWIGWYVKSLQSDPSRNPEYYLYIRFRLLINSIYKISIEEINDSKWSYWLCYFDLCFLSKSGLSTHNILEICHHPFCNKIH